MIFLGVYFVYQLVIGSFSFVQPQAGGGVAYFAHLGGIAFGLLSANVFATGRPRPLRPTY
jgi:membrane associated rhomboid family serine protease